MIITWLAYLTKKNYDRRVENFTASLRSLSLLRDSGARIVIVDNSEPDNFTCKQIRDELGFSFEIFKAKNEYCDIAGHYVGMNLAQQINDPYFAYAYDDFVFYDGTFVQPSIKFMDRNPDVSCMRISKYEMKNQQQYDTTYTSKDKNPEAVRHNNTRGNKQVIHDGPYLIDGHDFYKTTWRPISKPTLWRASHFENIMGSPSSCPTLQEYEKYMYDLSDARQQWVSSFIDLGVCHTFPQETSERIVTGAGLSRAAPIVDVSKISEALSCRERWL